MSTDDLGIIDSDEPNPGDHPNTDEQPSPETQGGFSIWMAVGLAFVAIVGIVAVVSGGGASDPSTASAANEELFAFEFGTAEGATTTLESHRGEPLVVNYFAAWCPPCRAELPDFEAVSQERASEVTFIGISKDNTTDAWTGLISDVGVTFETVYEGNSSGTYEIIGGLAMPTTAFITADGEVAHVHSGILNDSLLNQLIDEHLS